MPTKKKAKRSALRAHSKKLITLAMTVVILAVAYLVVSGNRNQVDAHLTAPLGTTTRSVQIDASELELEQDVDRSYDTEHRTIADDDAAAVSQLAEDATDEQ